MSSRPKLTRRPRASTRLPVPGAGGVPTVSAADARSLLLHAQQLASDPSGPVTTRRLNRLVEDMGFVQLDTINIVERAHHLTLFSRLDGYEHAMLATLLEGKRTLFEHWTHDASVIPTKWFSHWRPRFERYRQRDPEHSWWKARMGSSAKQVMAEVLQRVETHGPLMSKDFEKPDDANSKNGDAWWHWKPHKAALEYLWRCGELAVARRINFHKVYDLTSRVLPHVHDAPPPPADEHIDWACRSALERLGTATAREIAAFWHAIDLPAAGAWCKSAVERGEIVQLAIEACNGGQPRPGFAFHDWKARLDGAQRSSIPQRIRLLSPFDPVIRDRARAQRLFNFDYTFEAFTPAPKRRYGYYVLPILEGDRLVGRLNPKFHRDRGVLEIDGLWWEPKIKPTKRRTQSLRLAIEQLAAFVGAKTVSMARR
ncbi:MAG: winged helix DNA-binding domain-containing protein [Phycisphaerales bacterium]|nr:winged helix DNA-binding domain-containing protein [Phycisphaerales bacterium]